MDRRGKKRKMWECKCHCGNIMHIEESRLIHPEKTPKSCGKCIRIRYQAFVLPKEGDIS